MIIKPENLRKKINALGMPVDNNFYSTENFSWQELLINQKEIPSLQVLKNLLEVAKILEVYRKLLNCPLKITSGFRSKEYNKSIGGASNSIHIDGLAVDFIPLGQQVSKAYEKLDKIHLGGLERAIEWIHLDLRGHISRFDTNNIILASHFDHREHEKIFGVLKK